MTLDEMAHRVLDPAGNVLGWYIQDGDGDAYWVSNTIVASNFAAMLQHDLADEITLGNLTDSTVIAGEKVFFNVANQGTDNSLTEVYGPDPVTGELQKVSLSELTNTSVSTSVRSVSSIESIPRNKSIGDYYQEGSLPVTSEPYSASNSAETYYSPTFTKVIPHDGVDSVNYIYASEDVRVFGGIPAPYTLINLGWTKDAVIGPFGSLAERLEIAGATNGQFRANSLDTLYQDIPILSGDTVTVSGWILPGNESFNDNINFEIREVLDAYQGTTTTVNFDPELKQWQKFEEQLVYTGTNPRKNLAFWFGGETGDYVFITRLAYNIGPNRYYQKTSPTNRSSRDTTFAVYRPKNSVLSMGEIIYDPETVQNDA
ncbi:MAG: hypothetical protein AAFY76_16555, partial [Cyanobacteria bacterium J06649_11]